ncbi:DUF2125 domain-containing protein [Falsirhodobacter deserti]|uniref:DUF2125 domain-containing protein n=1 Tax=Falsirhodobacter deserti TaxID=1365611 RepID=UPI000FE39842|nr:DUF2125 domain-containing protein [Falsirhodobacter deserti]
MKPIYLTATCLAALVLATGAQADVTPEQVWADWQAEADRWEQTLTADSSGREGDSLVLRGLRTVQNQDGTRVEGTIDRIALRDMGDGRVEITGSADYPMTVTTSGTEESDPMTMSVLMTQQDMRTVASGDPGAVRYDMTAPRILIKINEVTEADGTVVPFEATVTANYVTANWVGGARTGSGKASTVDLTMDGESEGVRQSLDYEMTDVSISAAGDSDRMVGPAGQFIGQSAFAYAASTFRADLVQEGRTLNVAGESGAGTMNVVSTETSMDWESTVEDAVLHLTGDAVPGPIELQMESATSLFTLPLSEGEERQKMRMSVSLTDVVASETTWSLFDPRKALPRDPANLTMEMSGEGVFSEDPALAGPLSLVLEKLHLQLAGAELSGKGEAKLESAPANPDGTPAAPTVRDGTLNLTLKGGQGLIDAGVKAGLVPEAQALGARMMLGMFARPVEGQKDTVTSTIRMQDGQLTVNGQRLQ